MKRKSDLLWQRQTLKLKDNHSWRAQPGYKIFVADSGAIRFQFPGQWVITPKSDCIELLDKQPPNDNCRLAVSYLRIPRIDWVGLPLSKLITKAVKSDRRHIVARGEIRYVPRADVEVAWIEICFVDPTEKREALSRIAIARGMNIQALVTFDFWTEDAESADPIWDQVMHSIELGRYVDDPTAGDRKD